MKQFSKIILFIVLLLVVMGTVFGVTAYLATDKPALNQKPQAVSTPEPTEAPTPIVKDETSDLSSKVLATEDWKTYRNKKYGFEVKYPEDFEGQELEAGDILLEATKKDNGGSYYFTIKKRLNYKINQSQIVSSAEKIVIGGQTGYKYFYTEGMGKSGVVLIQVGQDELTISFDFIGDSQIAKTRKIYFQDFFNQILSTFKFIEK